MAQDILMRRLEVRDNLIKLIQNKICFAADNQLFAVEIKLHHPQEASFDCFEMEEVDNIIKELESLGYMIDLSDNYRTHGLIGENKR